MTAILVLAAAYLIGGIPFGYIVVRLATGRDIRSSGSGNIGATNVLRTAGRGLGVLTLLLDIVKGVAAVWLAERFTGSELWMCAAALAVMIGHAWPAMLKFKGGKAVACLLGAFLYLAPVPLLATVGVFVVTVAASRFISLGSIVAAGLFPLAVFLIEHPQWYVTATAAAAGAFVIYRHRANIERLRAGTENVFTPGGRRR
ncbi:MAG: glycerol-3-phosphate 1-O-acyltransferase PlsY [Bryobacteraceae bacterium]|nr:glycerol-3-phosphate 1-O-acyltransferase PlsY [Bryobacteraceae bacterium]